MTASTSTAAEPAAAPVVMPEVKATPADAPLGSPPPASEPDVPRAAQARGERETKNQGDTKNKDAGTIRTPVVGGWEGSPPVVPTAFDMETGDGAIVGHNIWNGDWVGVSTFASDYLHLDTETGDYSFHTTQNFTGTWQGKAGTMIWEETVKGNMITGAVIAEVDIISGEGDETFRCSSGHFTWAGYAVIPASYGGYHGEWVHGCPAER